MIHPTGGLVYHARAMRHGATRWTGFREAVGAWLEDWRPGCEGLLLIGPSGGYSLPDAWLSRFSEVVAVDFDPMARWMFARRHPLCRVKRWISEDVFPVGGKGLNLAPLSRILEEHPDHAVLFSNVLGQVAPSTAVDVEGDLASLREGLKGRHWASYHDRLSAAQRPRLPKDRRHRDDRELADLAFSGSIVVTSHSTALLGQGLDCETFAWECALDYWHLIEGCREPVR